MLVRVVENWLLVVLGVTVMERKDSRRFQLPPSGTLQYVYIYIHIGTDSLSRPETIEDEG